MTLLEEPLDQTSETISPKSHRRSLPALVAMPTKPQSLNLHRVGRLDPLVTGRFASSMVHDELQCRAPPCTIGKHVFEHHVVLCPL